MIDAREERWREFTNLGEEEVRKRLGASMFADVPPAVVETPS
jgi:hypothetical protein